MEPHLFRTQELKRLMERSIADAKRRDFEAVIFEIEEEEIILTGMVRQWFPAYKVSKDAKNHLTVSWKE
jgi:hypothetical protein